MLLEREMGHDDDIARDIARGVGTEGRITLRDGWLWVMVKVGLGE